MDIYKKLLEVQKEIGAIKKDSTNPFYKSKYFDINVLLAEVKPVLNKHGLVLTQGLSHIGGKLALRTTVSSSERDSIPSENGSSDVDGKNGLISEICPLPECEDAQKYGSAITYFRRYALQSLLALEAEDDDGEATKKVETTKGKNNDLQF